MQLYFKNFLKMQIPPHVRVPGVALQARKTNFVINKNELLHAS